MYYLVTVPRNSRRYPTLFPLTPLIFRPSSRRPLSQKCPTRRQRIASICLLAQTKLERRSLRLERSCPPFYSPPSSFPASIRRHNTPRTLYKGHDLFPFLLLPLVLVSPRPEAVRTSSPPSLNEKRGGKKDDSARFSRLFLADRDAIDEEDVEVLVKSERERVKLVPSGVLLVARLFFLSSVSLPSSLASRAAACPYSTPRALSRGWPPPHPRSCRRTA